MKGGAGGTSYRESRLNEGGYRSRINVLLSDGGSGEVEDSRPKSLSK